MNRHERRKASAQARRTRIEIRVSPLLEQLITCNPTAMETLAKSFRQDDVNVSDCYACGMPWSDEVRQDLLVEVTIGDQKAAGLACEACHAVLGPEGIAKEVRAHHTK